MSGADKAAESRAAAAAAVDRHHDEDETEREWPAGAAVSAGAETERWADLPRCSFCNEKGTHAPQCDRAQGEPPQALDEAVLRLYDTVAAMRAVIGHEHIEPWPCPVKAVDDALSALAHKHGLWDRPTPADMADNIATRLAQEDRMTSETQTQPTLDQIVNDEVPVYMAQSEKVRAVVEGVWQAFVDRDYREPSISPKELMDVLEAVMAKEQA